MTKQRVCEFRFARKSTLADIERAAIRPLPAIQPPKSGAKWSAAPNAVCERVATLVFSDARDVLKSNIGDAFAEHFDFAFANLAGKIAICHFTNSETAPAHLERG